LSIALLIIISVKCSNPLLPLAPNDVDQRVFSSTPPTSVAARLRALLRLGDLSILERHFEILVNVDRLLAAKVGDREWLPEDLDYLFH
jgi:hypothetical protein